MIHQPRISLNGKFVRGCVWLNNETWLEPEKFAYMPDGRNAWLRRAFVVLRQNEHNPIVLPYGKKRIVWASINDTTPFIFAQLIIGRFSSRRIRGFISNENNIFIFTPDANPGRCLICKNGDGCKELPK